jgi:hypothetical protein
MTVKAKVIAAALLVLVVLSAVPIRYVFDSQMGATLIWNGQKAWVFIPLQRLGWSGPGIAFVWDFLASALSIGGAMSHERVQAWQTVITITEEGVTEHTLPAPFQTLGVLDGAIVGGSDNVGLARWEGSKVVPLPDHVKSRYWRDVRSAVHLDGPDWFARSSLLNRAAMNSAFEFPLDGTTATLTSTRYANGSKKLTLRINGQERVIWSLDGQPRFVSASEFKRLSEGPVTADQ